MSDPLSNIPTSGDPLAGAPATPPPTQPATPPAKSTTPAAPVQRTASGDSTAAAAANEAKSVAQDAGESGKAVAATAKDEAQQVATEAKNHAQDLFHQARGEVTAQASTQQQRAAELLRALSGELGQMGRSADTGMAAGLVNQASGHVEQIAGWLEEPRAGGSARRHQTVCPSQPRHLPGRRRAARFRRWPRDPQPPGPGVERWLADRIRTAAPRRGLAAPRGPHHPRAERRAGIRRRAGVDHPRAGVPSSGRLARAGDHQRHRSRRPATHHGTDGHADDVPS